MDSLSACSLCTVYVLCPQSSEEGIGTGVTDPCESPSEWQELNTRCRKEEQSVLLISEPFFQPLPYLALKVFNLIILVHRHK